MRDTNSKNIVRHKARCSVWTLHCTQSLKFSTKSQNDLSYHNAQKHSAPKPNVTSRCEICYQEFPGFYVLRQHKNTHNGFPIRTANVDLDNILNEVDDANFKEELLSCQQFLVNSELERARHKVFNYAIKNLNAKIVDKKLDQFLSNLKCATKVNLAFAFILKKKENGGFRYFYAHENNTLLDWSKKCCFTRTSVEK